MVAMGPQSVLSMIVALLFGGVSEDPGGPSDSRPPPGFMGNAPIHAELNLAEARSFVANSPQARELLTGASKTDGAAFRREAAAQLATLLKTSDTALLKAVNQVQRIHFSVLGFAADDDALRLGLLLDCGSARDVLAGALGTPADDDSPLSASPYGAALLYQIGQEDERIWMAERDGRILLALDPLLVQRFISSTAGEGRAQNPARRPAKPRAMLNLTVNPNPFISNLLVAMEHDRDEFLMMGSLLDLGAWDSFTASYDGRELVANLTFAEGGSYAGRLAGSASPPSVLKWIPETSFLSLAVNLDQPEAFGKALLSAFQRGFAWGGEHGQMQQFFEETRQGLGLDLETEVLPNMSEMALVFAQPGDEPIAFFYKAKNETAARQLVSKLRATHAPEGGQMTRQGAWETMDMDGAMVGRNGSTIIVGPQDNRQLEAMLRPVETPKTALPRFRNQFPDATAALCFSPWGAAMPKGMPAMEPIRVGLKAKGRHLQLRARVDLASLAMPLGFAGGRARKQSRNAQCLNNLRQVTLACLTYAADHDDTLPPDLVAVRKYVGDPAVFRCPVSDKPYVYNSTVSGVQMGTLGTPWKTVLVRDPAGGHAGGGNVAFLDGHVERQNPQEFQQTVNSAVTEGPR